MKMPDIKYWLYERGIDLDNFNLRETLNDNPKIVYAVAVVLAVVCLMLVVCQMVGGSTPPLGSYQVIYYDTTNQQVRVVEHDASKGMHPSPLEGTTDVFEAAVFHCGERPEGLDIDGMTLQELEQNGLFIGWLQKTDAELEGDELQIMEGGYEYRRVGGTQWWSTNSPRVDQILRAPYERCEDAQPFLIR